MAEILLSLTIIGVVAAITLPSLTGNINERTWNTQRKALYARFSQAIALMPALNGYGTLTEDASGSVTEDTAAETFLTAGLSKVLKINNICDNEHLADCGIPTKITNLAGSVISEVPKTLVDLNDMFNGSFDATSANYQDGNRIYTYSQINTKASAFETQNGESIVVYYNPNCKSDMLETDTHYTQSKMCANFIYDLNGNKGPNTVGKDIGFISVLYPTDSSVVAPVVQTADASNSMVGYRETASYCNAQDVDSRIPSKEELSSMFYNKLLLGGNALTGVYWSGSRLIKNSQLYVWAIYMTTGRLIPGNQIANIRCVKR